MKGKRLAIILSVFITAAIICAVFLFLHTRNQDQEPRLPPDLTGEWIQTDIDGLDYYHIASVRDGLISVYRYRPAYDDSELIWIGTCPEPDTADEPYRWESENRIPHNQKSIYTLRSETIPFRYAKGLISFDISFNSILKMAVSMERWGTPSQFDNPQDNFQDNSQADSQSPDNNQADLQSPDNNNNNISGEIASPNEIPVN